MIELRAQDVESGEDEVVGREGIRVKGCEASGLLGPVRERVSHSRVYAHAEGVSGDVACCLVPPLP